MRHANWTVVENTDEKLVIRDMGPWHFFPTVTNDAEWVVARCLESMKPGQKLLCFDSEGDLDELVIRDGEFFEFKDVATKP